MRRFMPTLFVAAIALLGTLSLGGCIVPPHHDRGHSGHRDGPDRHHDGQRNRDDNRGGNNGY